MATLRSDIRTRTRDYLYEPTANIFSENQLNRLVTEEVNSLAKKDIYKEEIYTISTVANQQDYQLPTGTEKVELVERNDGTSSTPNWSPLNGCDNYQGSLNLPYIPESTDSIRIHIKKSYTAPTDDITAMDMPDSETEVVVWGVVVRAYKMLIGYLRSKKSWDTVTKPGDLSIPVIMTWLREAKTEYDKLVQQYATAPRPREINLVS